MLGHGGKALIEEKLAAVVIRLDEEMVPPQVRSLMHMACMRPISSHL
jgi:hypothetical protein